MVPVRGRGRRSTAASASPAHAYLDPGTGSMILQVLAGGAAGLALAGKLYWHRFLTVIGMRAPEPVEPVEPDAAASATPGRTVD